MIDFIIGFLLALLVVASLSGQKCTVRVLHRHQWSPWTEWHRVSSNREGTVWWERARRCPKCRTDDAETAAKHICADRECSHYDLYSVMFVPGTNVARLEKELGMRDG